MPTFEITEKEFVNITRTNVYKVKANSEEEALDMVMKGIVFPITKTEFEEFENVEYDVN